jgi:thiamine pyrophosphate-dependent acetolactate synthase large subunit-like protein
VTVASCSRAWSWKPRCASTPTCCTSSGWITPTTWWRSRKRKYQRLSGVEFGPVDFKVYADAFGAKGFAVESAEALEPTLRAAMDVDGPAVVAIPVDYSDNPLLMGQLHLSQIL